ncbi:MAG: sulfite exporter TauE/SafE family protein [Rhodospirillales bacterium]|jgi:hypothetical protein|nr:sulfite exporter TauE/SafE family protein [Rhodospirillales bacterium]MDP6774327.1 sulfite exporter TauE/SafE family protein [Rhodospirillales bacterium]|tara:strand:+ start:175 stop:1002 length:828 start_codon:yes stop_codon:yes gene_type:complete
MDLSILTALTIGFLGSTHCIGMCGGIVGALNTGLPQTHRQSRFSQIAYHFTYNAGRILSYSVAGAIAGLLGAQSTRIPLGVVYPVGELIAGLVMIALGLYLAGWWRAIARVENAGQYIWKYIQPLGKRFLPVKTPMHALGLGLVWGWLPCGLVYSALALSMVSASPLPGALLMLGFGLGTLPMLLTMGGAYEHLRGMVRNPIMLRLAGVTVILFGAYTSLTSLIGHGGTGHHGTSRAQTAVSLLFHQEGVIPIVGVGELGGLDRPRGIPHHQKAA